MADADLAFSSIADVAPRIARGEVSSAALCEALLARIEALNARLNAYWTITAESARAAAAAADAMLRAGASLGPLHGVPVAIKDSVWTRGVRTTFGSPLHAGFVPDADAAVVERLKRAGAVILGKTGVHEVTLGTTSANVHFGPVRNPYDLERHPGGSSGGSAAALAAGLAHGAIGSDTGGSIRQPAACCGIVGIKPTFGRVSKFGAFPLAWSMDHVGPMTRTVEDAALMLGVLAGHDPRDPSSVARPVEDYAAALTGEVQGVRIGVSRRYHYEGCDPEVLAAVEAALEVLRELGAEIREIELPDMAAVHAAATVIMFSEAAACHEEDLATRPDAYSAPIRGALELGRLYTATQYVQAQRLRRLLMDETLRAIAGVDAIALPTSPIPPTPIEDDVPEHAILRGRNCISFNALSLPAISVPCGFTRGGLPVGLQIVGHPFAEAGVLRIAHAYEQATPWHARRPEFPA